VINAHDLRLTTVTSDAGHATPSDAAIVIHQLTKVFHPIELRFGGFPSVRRGQPVIALQNVSLTVRRGEVLGLLGTNGAGKTTLLKILATLILPTTGQVAIKGRDLVRDAERVKEMVGLVTGDERSFYWRLTGRQNLEFFGAFDGLDRETTVTRIEELRQELALDALDRRFGLYSTGMRQRLAVARALLRRPSILLLDEPTRSLDPLATGMLHRFLRNMLVNELGCTLVLSTHSLAEAEALCDRFAVLHRGRVLTSSTGDVLGHGMATVAELSALFGELVKSGDET
jgi:ABC-2 type transport system ATP-binding protein